MLKERPPGGGVQVWYYRAQGAGARLGPEDVEAEVVAGAAVLHVTGITPALGERPAAAVSHAVAIAREAGVPVSVDVNHRASLIAKDPDAHKGERIIVYGRVTQFDAATGDDTFRASVDGVDHPGDAYGFDTNTMLSGNATALKDVVNDDLFRAEVTVAGSMSYGTQIGGSTTVPTLTVDTIKVIGRG